MKGASRQRSDSHEKSMTWQKRSKPCQADLPSNQIVWKNEPFSQL